MTELPDWMRRQIQRQADGPWCDACGLSMPKESRDRGELTHPSSRCSKGEPDPVAPQPHPSPEPSKIGTSRPAERVNVATGLTAVPHRANERPQRLMPTIAQETQT